VLDDAHGIGVLGDGRGSLAHFGCALRVSSTWPPSQGAGGYGAFVAGDATAVEC